MKVAVLGLWHLGSVTAEPGLADMIAGGLSARKLSFTTDVAAAVGAADVVWITFDTPVDDDDRADVESARGHLSPFGYVTG